ncbi:response regulator transcription factor [Neptunitalea lumnitzerae]|uniref:HTH luxR-type domain-containing protein n=1 Tax=Neptunitalea lumnitzerae TaxID=2965509 RepID=A0ABQ5MEZ5_9FLAO|nr:LuxR C-terminal-related transcriptional regulator [Neptunitalea sp. Y10]GLB47968.1 hypothetical protein Y10_03360 [Neptunitalea sp. Y10]
MKEVLHFPTFVTHQLLSSLCMKRLLFLFVVLVITTATAQNTISGFVNPAELATAKEVLLLEVDPAAPTVKDSTKVVATAMIDSNGAFAFKKELFTTTDKVYQLALTTENVSANGSIPQRLHTLKTFILSEADSMVFNGTTTSYQTTSMADKEWSKFKKFEKTQDFKSLNASEIAQYLTSTKGYIKDSLQILLVKLMSIQELDEKQLLDTDIKENPDYYEQLLVQLKESNVAPAYYMYLENKLHKYHYQRTNTFFRTSVLVNIVLVVLVVLVVLQWVKAKKQGKVTPEVVLSKQETLVKNLILAGKTNKEIAATLFISVSTVKTHITNIYSKLQVSSRKELLQQYQNTTGTSTYLVPE